MLPKLIPVLLAFLMIPPLRAQEPTPEAEVYFKTYCLACHNIGGGRKVGPDLKGVSQRQEREWLKGFILDPTGVLASGDPYAQKMLEESNMAAMTPPPGITPEMADQLLDLIDIESAKPVSQFGMVAVEKPMTPEMEERGALLFSGEETLSAGGPACVGCHSVEPLGGFGGGRLGPDLTEAYARLNGQAALAGWLSAPPSEVMAPVFQKHPLTEGEIDDLIAYLRRAGLKGSGPDEMPNTGRTIAVSPGFVFTGAAFAAAVLFLLQLIWRNRFRAVRKPLLESSQR